MTQNGMEGMPPTKWGAAVIFKRLTKIRYNVYNNTR